MLESLNIISSISQLLPRLDIDLFLGQNEVNLPCVACNLIAGTAQFFNICFVNLASLIVVVCIVVAVDAVVVVAFEFILFLNLILHFGLFKFFV